MLRGREGRAQSVGVGRAEEQRRGEDKPVVICLFNWLKSSEESCAVIPARAGPGPSASLAGSVGCRGGPGLPFARRETGWEAATRGQRWLLPLRHFRNLEDEFRD